MRLNVTELGIVQRHLEALCSRRTARKEMHCMYFTKSSTFFPGFVFPSLYREHHKIIWVGRDTFKGHLVQLSATNRDAQSSVPLTLGVSSDGAPTTSPGNLHQCLTILPVKNFFLTSNLNLPSFSLKLSAFVPLVIEGNEVWKAGPAWPPSSLSITSDLPCGWGKGCSHSLPHLQQSLLRCLL